MAGMGETTGSIIGEMHDLLARAHDARRGFNLNEEHRYRQLLFRLAPHGEPENSPGWDRYRQLQLEER